MAGVLPSLFLLSFILTIGTFAASTKTGFSLELISRFRANLTKSELAPRLQQSQSGISYMRQSILESKSKANTTTMAIRSPVHERGGHYLVSLSIGTDQGSQPYYLQMDTGSGLTWTQCQPCNPCFPQSAPTFDPRRSPTYKRIPSDDPFCVPPYQRRNDICTYAVTYADGFSINGVISKETFTFMSSAQQQPESIPDLVFGCTHSSAGESYYDGDPAGILGLAARAESFITQLGEQTLGRFSYCLFHYNTDSSSYLRFGDDIIMNGPVQRTPLLIEDGLYYLHLNDISINAQRLNLRPGIFELNPDGTGGFIIDSGAGTTHLIDEAFHVVEFVLVAYFEHFNLERVDGEGIGYGGYKICYRMRSDFDSFPSMTLHLEGADLKVERDLLFFFVDERRDVFCFSIMPDDSVSTLGAYQQFDTRFTYDIMHRELLFVPEVCARDA